MRSFYGSTLLAVRYVSSPRKLFISNKTLWQFWWNEKIPSAWKYGTGIVSLVGCLVNIHPNLLITIAPPVGVGSYFLYSHLVERKYVQEVEIAKKSSHTIKVPKYDESNIDLIVEGIDNEYDYFKSVVFLKVSDVINSNLPLNYEQLFIDQNRQVIWKLGNIENFVVLKIDDNTFIKMGVEFLRNQRVGVVDIYLVDKSEDSNENQNIYDVTVMITPLKQKSILI